MGSNGAGKRGAKSAKSAALKWKVKGSISKEEEEDQDSAREIDITVPDATEIQKVIETGTEKRKIGNQKRERDAKAKRGRAKGATREEVRDVEEEADPPWLENIDQNTSGGGGGVGKREAKGVGKGTKTPIPKKGEVGSKTGVKGGAKDGKKGAKQQWKGGKGSDGPVPFSEFPGARTMQEVENDLEQRKKRSEAAVPRRSRTSEDPSKQPLEAKGAKCEVRKHSGMGCAVVTVESEAARNAVLSYADKTNLPSARPGGGKFAEIDIDGTMAQLRPHHIKLTGQDVKTDIFVAWGHQVEKEAPLEAQVIAEAIDKVIVKAMPPPAPKTINRLPGPTNFLPMAQPVPGIQQQAQVPQMTRPPPPPIHTPGLGQPTPPAVATWPSLPVTPPYPYGYMPPSPYSPQQPDAAAMQRQVMEMRAAAARWPTTLARPVPVTSWPTSPVRPVPMTSPSVNTFGNGMSADALSFTPSSNPLSAPGTEPENHNVPTGGLTSETMNKRKILPIVDPDNGRILKTLNLHFKQSEPRKPLLITNPSNGQPIQI